MPPLIQWVFVLFGAWLAYLCIQGLLEKKKNLKQAKEAANWPSVTGRVVSSKIEEGRNRNSEGQMIHTYEPKVTYGYTAGGKEHQATRIAFGKILYYQPREAEAFMQTYAQGNSIEVFHDPASPSEAVLDRDPAHATKLVIADTFMLIAGVVMLGVGLSAMLG